MYAYMYVCVCVCVYACVCVCVCMCVCVCVVASMIREMVPQKAEQQHADVCWRMLAVASVIREMVRQKEEQQQAVAAGTQFTCFTGTRVQNQFWRSSSRRRCKLGPRQGHPRQKFHNARALIVQSAEYPQLGWVPQAGQAASGRANPPPNIPPCQSPDRPSTTIVWGLKLPTPPPGISE